MYCGADIDSRFANKGYIGRVLPAASIARAGGKDDSWTGASECNDAGTVEVYGTERSWSGRLSWSTTAGCVLVHNRWAADLDASVM
jgi:hypothetical protein